MKWCGGREFSEDLPVTGCRDLINKQEEGVMQTEKKGMNSMFLYWATNQWHIYLSGEAIKWYLGDGIVNLVLNTFILKQLWNIPLESFRAVGGISTSWKILI